MLESLDLNTVLTIVIAVVGTFAGGFWLKAKGKLSKVVKLGSETLDVATTLSKVLEDDKVTKDEIAALKKELADVKAAWKDLVS
jgi:hypothetical protein